MSGEEKRPLMNYGDLASHYVHLSEQPWKPTPSPGIDLKILLSVPEAGLLTALFRWAPGTELPLHEHVEIEQAHVLEGNIVDDEGEVRKGDYVWHPKGNNQHIARSRCTHTFTLPEAESLSRR
ncbi:cupin domain-containing protein [Paraburkholderia atlantica]|uniref:cupin domain-containing protein n=2 Tax=Paraburkholderia atlantica TaxID=2654982 RepID=UPI003D1C8395